MCRMCDMKNTTDDDYTYDMSTAYDGNGNRFAQRVHVTPPNGDSIHMEMDCEEVVARIAPSFHVHAGGNGSIPESRMMFIEDSDGDENDSQNRHIVEMSLRRVLVDGVYSDGTRFVAENVFNENCRFMSTLKKNETKRRREEDDSVMDGDESSALEANGKRMRSEFIPDAPAVKERVIGKEYRMKSGKHEGKVMIWGNGYWKCEHG